ncbi:MAG TPA: hypothetical protein VIG66_04675, partial [Noviherbaspirillum sp.]
MQQLAPPYTLESFASALRAYPFEAELKKAKAAALHRESFPLVVWMAAATPAVPEDDGKNLP